MKRIRNFHRTTIGIALLTLLGFVLAVSLLLFTPWGNRAVEPILENSLSSALDTPIKIEEFSLTYNRFHLLFQDGYGNTASTQGGFSALTLRMYAHYRVECFVQGGFNPLPSPLKTEGSLNGGIASFAIRGSATLFKGEVHYKIELHRFHLEQLDLTLDQIAYEPMLHYLDYPSITDTMLSGTIMLKGFEQRDITGAIHLATLTKRFEHLPIKSEDDNSSFNLKTLLADKFGHIKPFNVEIALNASLEHAGVLEQFVGIALDGALTAQGTLEGDETLLKLKASSDVANSDTKLTLLIPDLEPSSITFDLRNGDAMQVFELFALPAPFSGTLSAYAELNTTSGKLHTHIRNGTTIPSVLKEHYHLTQPLIHFTAEVNADLSEKGVHYRGAFQSDLARLEIDNTTTHDQMLRELLRTLR